MKHSKANTIPAPVFVTNKGLHKLTPLLDDIELSKVCGGYGIRNSIRSTYFFLSWR